LVNAPVSIAWNVLTDYGDYEQFFPSVAESHLIRSEGNYHVFEQINVVRVFLFTNRSRVVIAATESYPKKIDFQLVEGDLKSLQGVWRFEPVASDDGGSPMQVLVTHQVAVAPKSSSSRSLFLRVYQNNIQDTLAALKQELEWRSQQQSHRSN
jgi:ribosome-associated toxin RatA of RatAB toxin-antitoxin module